MKKYNIFLALLLSLPVISLQSRAFTISGNHEVPNVKISFQPPQQRSPEEIAKRETEWMKRDVELTTEQIPKVDSINLAYAIKFKVIREQSDGNREGIRDKRAELDLKKRSEFALILTAEQLRKYDDRLAARRQRMQNRGN
jgi:hypothetical protein